MAAAAARSVAQAKKKLKKEKHDQQRRDRQMAKATEKLELELASAHNGILDWEQLSHQGFDPEIFELMKNEYDERKRKYEEETVKRPLKDPEKFSGLAKSWIIFSAKIEKITAPKEGQPDPFGQFIIGIIVVAGILVGLQTYDCAVPPTHFGAEDEDSGCNSLAENSVIITIDWIVLGIFTIECLLKMMSEGLEPWRYWTGPEWRWNNFDFIIVLFCMPGIGDLIPGDGAVALLRLMRLMRVMKLVRQIPQLQMIIMGLVGGFRAISYIMMLMALIFYLYACAAIIFFGKNDPFHFGDLPKSFNTLFRMSTLEDWTDVMYINYYGCASPMFGSGLYSDHPREIEAEYIGRMETYAHASESPADDAPMYNETDRSFSPSYILCDPNHEPSKVVVIIYMMTFIVISALVVLSLVIGAITMSMGGALAEMKSMEEKKMKSKKMKAARRRLEEKAALEGGELLPWRRRCCIWFVKCTGGGDDVNDGNKLKLVLGELMSGFGPASDKRKMSVYSLQQNEKMKDDELTGWRKVYMQLAETMNRIERSPYFSNSITITIVIAGILVGIQTDADILEKNEALFNVLDYIILIIFIIEIVVKMVAKEFRPWMYFFNKGVADSWNWFDFLIVLASVIPTGGGNLVVILRLLRLLRVLKVLKAFPGLLVIVSALISGLSSIGYIAVIMVLFFYVWGILGMMLFRMNDPWHFGTLHDTIITLFRATTLEDWTDVMYTNMYGCDHWGYTREAFQTNSRSWCQYPKRQVVLAVVYFWFLIIIGSFVIMPLFIGVVVSGMEEAVEKQNKDKGMKRDLKKVLKKLDMKPDDPYIELYRVCFRLIDVDEGGTLGKDEIVLALDASDVKIENERVNDIMKQSLGDHVPEGEFYPDEVEVDFAKFIALMHSLMQHSAVNANANPGRTRKMKNLEDSLDQKGQDPEMELAHLRDVSDESDGMGPPKGPTTYNRPGYRGTKVVPAAIGQTAAANRSLAQESENPANLPGSPLRGPTDQPAVQANPITDVTNDMAPLEAPQEAKGDTVAV